MMASQQAAGGRHLAPASAPYIWRALVWQENSADYWQPEHSGWKLMYVFDMATQTDAEHFALDAVAKPWDDGVTTMHYVIGEVEQ